MSTPSRLSLAVEAGLLELPEAGRIAVFAPREGLDMSALPAERCHLITGSKPEHDHFAGLGLNCAVEPEGRYGAALICLPRAKALAHALIAQAAEVTDGVLIVDGAKTDGVESILKECRKRAEVSAPVNKAHGKLFWFHAGPGVFADWAMSGPQEIDGGFVTVPGVFSADGIDPASRLLADHLPRKLGRHVVDLGGGWGYLSARALKGRDEIERIDLIEADHAALACARENVADARAVLHWEDATRWQPDAPVDAVITNPPFHTGRAADPDLGRAFIRAAARMLKPRGELWLVANRHLPYETEMRAHFSHVDEVAGDSRFKVLHGRGVSRKAR